MKNSDGQPELRGVIDGRVDDRYVSKAASTGAGRLSPIGVGHAVVEYAW